ncbi:hypothetical protein FGO68_gene5395 [Halteria grandinella]|uniref:Uncharacterized protein n=1 Tax=Halteria grandinella TaxID=5974 RepID=A0A8J8T862_HALGN|nr:hypothetical protein FGO68_gene5395 [Halteria grandinella]
MALDCALAFTTSVFRFPCLLCLQETLFSFINSYDLPSECHHALNISIQEKVIHDLCGEWSGRGLQLLRAQLSVIERAEEGQKFENQNRDNRA